MLASGSQLVDIYSISSLAMEIACSNLPAGIVKMVRFLDDEPNCDSSSGRDSRTEIQPAAPSSSEKGERARI